MNTLALLNIIEDNRLEKEAVDWRSVKSIAGDAAKAVGSAVDSAVVQPSRFAMNAAVNGVAGYGFDGTHGIAGSTDLSGLQNAGEFWKKLPGAVYGAAKQEVATRLGNALGDAMLEDIRSRPAENTAPITKDITGDNAPVEDPSFFGQIRRQAASRFRENATIEDGIKQLNSDIRKYIPDGAAAVSKFEDLIDPNSNAMSAAVSSVLPEDKQKMWALAGLMQGAKTVSDMSDEFISKYGKRPLSEIDEVIKEQFGKKPPQKITAYPAFDFSSDPYYNAVTSRGKYPEVWAALYNDAPDYIRYPYSEEYAKGDRPFSPAFNEARRKSFFNAMRAISQQQTPLLGSGNPSDNSRFFSLEGIPDVVPIYVSGYGGGAGDGPVIGKAGVTKNPMMRSIMMRESMPFELQYPHDKQIRDALQTINKYGSRAFVLGHSLGGGSIAPIAKDFPYQKFIALDPVDPVSHVYDSPLPSNVKVYKPDDRRLVDIGNLSAAIGGRAGEVGPYTTYHGTHTAGTPSIVDYEFAKATGRLPEYMELVRSGAYDEDPMSIPGTFPEPLEDTISSAVENTKKTLEEQARKKLQEAGEKWKNNMTWSRP